MRKNQSAGVMFPFVVWYGIHVLGFALVGMKLV